MIKIRDMTNFTLAEPAISARAMQIHYEQHYKTYVNNANELLDSENEESIIDLIDNLPEEGKLYNNVAQIFNHEFFFEQFLRKFRKKLLTSTPPCARMILPVKRAIFLRSFSASERLL